MNLWHMANNSSNGDMKETESGQFTSIPILSLEQARNPNTKPEFLSKLRDALLNVGFLYLTDTGLPSDLIQQVKDETFKFFDESILPLEEKERVEMKNEKSFLGWSRVSTFEVSLSTLPYASTQHLLKILSSWERNMT
jgi:isopenicillin N synthase-like dioxygenase